MLLSLSLFFLLCLSSLFSLSTFILSISRFFLHFSFKSVCDTSHSFFHPLSCSYSTYARHHRHHHNRHHPLS
ncbi:MAG: hypothetical protein JOS17DRAFT_448163 [Linnemannia elongata]|nr:MAG: hypothetical protein JOS17DRAFT_448163 [Linnemannia elongata]